MDTSNLVGELAILDTLKTGVVVHAPDTSILYNNTRASELLGLTQAQMEGRVAIDPYWHFIDENSHPLAPEQYPISVVLTTQKELKNMTVGIVTTDGQECTWVLVNGSPHFNQAGELTHIIINFHDITEQKRLELDIKNQSHRYQTLLRNASDGIFILNKQGCVVEASTSWCEMIGYSRKEAIGMHISQWNAQYSAKELEDIIERRFSSSERLQFETTHVNASGKTYPVEVNVVLIKLDDEEMLYCSTRDVTFRKEAEQNLNDTLLQLRESIHAGNIGLWDWNLETNEVEFSSKYKSQIGYADDEFSNTFENWKRNVHIEDIDATMDKVHDCIKNKAQNYEAMFRFRHKNGSYRWILAHGSVISKDNRPIRMIGSHIDITDRKELEEDLRQSQKMEAIGQLAGGIAHDFNNQLAGIMGFAEVLKLKLSDESLLPYLDKIINTAEHSADLTKQLLTFSRKKKFNLLPVSVHNELNSVIELLQRTIDRRIDIKTEFEANTDQILGDSSAIYSLFINLGVNASDAMPNGGELTIRSSLETNKNDKEGTFIRIDVIDTGEGISPEIQNKIYEPFFTTKNIGRGTGMGLASVYGSVKQMSGFIEFESEQGAGTCFSVFFPLQQKREHVAQAESNKTESRVIDKCILIVDDESALRDICKEYVETLNHKALEAKNGQEALRVYQNHKDEIDLVILDMMMPVMTGVEAFEQLKQIDPDIKVVIATGYVDNLELENIQNKGVEKVIYKPYSFKELSTTIKEILK